MTTDDLIPLLEQAGICQEVWFEHHRSIERFAALVAAAEREACAKVCADKVDAEYATGKVDHNEMAWTQACAIAIRARGESK